MRYKLYRDHETGKIDINQIGQMYAIITTTNITASINLEYFYTAFHSNEILHKQNFEIVFLNEKATQKYGKKIKSFYHLNNVPAITQILNMFNGSFNL